MIFELIWSPEAEARFETIVHAAESAAETRKKTSRTKASKQEGLFKQVYKCLQLLSTNPRHPGLATHEYDSLENPYDPNRKVVAAYVQNTTPGEYRLFWCYGPKRNQITVIAITPHP